MPVVDEPISFYGLLGVLDNSRFGWLVVWLSGVAPVWLVRFLNGRLGLFRRFVCEHVRGGEPVFDVMPVSVYRDGKLVLRSELALCRRCVGAVA